MRIGLNYKQFVDVSFILYALKQGEIKADFRFEGLWGKPNHSRRFEITLGDDCYIFSHDYEDIADCDRKIHLVHNSLQEDDRYDRCIFTPGDVIEDKFTDELIEQFLNNGNTFLSYVTSKVKHDNFLFAPLFGFVLHYYELGFKFLNYYKNSNTNKNQLLGAYCNKTHIGGSLNTRRTEIFDRLEEILEADCKRYESPNSSFDMLVDSYRYFGQWFNVHMSGYTDYNTSACNIIFETIDSLGTHHNSIGRFMLTEKTLKSLLFSKEEIFFMWYGHEMFLPYLQEQGFWFLNFEFYDPDDTENGETAIYNSLIKTAKYLKDLKNQMGTNESVYKYLLNNYRDKLENNSKSMDRLLNNCDIKDKVINLLKYE